MEPFAPQARSTRVGLCRTIVVSAPFQSGRRRFAVPSLHRHSFDPNSLKLKLTTAGALGLLAFPTIAGAQSQIIGFDVRINRMFETDISDFVGNFAVITAPLPILSFAIDHDATATTLWVVAAPPSPAAPTYGTVDSTGIFTPVGTLSGGMLGASGLTAHPDGVTWYLTEVSGAVTNLYRGNVTTGSMTLVGPLSAGGLMIDIACDSQGNLIGHSISTDSFYSIDPNTAVATLLGAHGLAANFAQGMDFDWSTDTLYATIYTGGGTGGFYSVDTTTGAVTLIQDTFSLNAEMEISVKVGTGGNIGTNYCTAVANSTGSTGDISATGSTIAANNDVTLMASALPNNAFGFFLTSMTQGFIANPGGSTGNLCLGGSIGRYVGPGQVQNTGTVGSFSLVLNLNQTPSPTGFVAISTGQTWNFQAWHRDQIAGTATSNFTDGLEISFN